MYLTQSLHRSIASQPNAIASVYRDRRRSFAEFGERVARFARALRTLARVCPLSKNLSNHQSDAAE